MKILIVEDDVMLADMLEATLLNQGHDVCGMAMDVAELSPLCACTDLMSRFST